KEGHGDGGNRRLHRLRRLRPRLPGQLPDPWPRGHGRRMTPDRAYRWLMSASRRSEGDGFDLHVCASILAVAIAQADEEGLSLAATSGLDASTLRAFASGLFPELAVELAEMAGAVEPAPGPEEKSVVDILLLYASGRLEFVRPLALMIARRCQEPRHLWQDLGLRD